MIAAFSQMKKRIKEKIIKTERFLKKKLLVESNNHFAWEIQININKKKRGDNINVSIIRRITSLPSKLLNLLFTESQQKLKDKQKYYMKNKDKVFFQFWKWFEDWFLQVFCWKEEINIKDKMLIFADFIQLSFPKEKTTKILGLKFRDIIKMK